MGADNEGSKGSEAMKRLLLVLALLVGAVAVAAARGPSPEDAKSSSHREAPAISEDPAADNTDLWAWVKSGTHDKLYAVASYNPLEEPAGGPNFHKFSDDVLYEVHLSDRKSVG